MVEVEMVSDYSVLGTLYTLMDSFGEKTDEMYGDDGNVTLRLQVEVSRVESLSEAVRDATNGKVEVRRVER
jgi:putative IMPACT (imprinted ancient) family translation regulator